MGNEISAEKEAEQPEPSAMPAEVWSAFRARIVHRNNPLKLWVRKVEPGRKVKIVESDETEGHSEWQIYKSSELFYMLALTNCEDQQLFVKPSKKRFRGGRVLVLERGKTPSHASKIPDRRTFELVHIPQNDRTVLFHVKSKRYLCYHARKKQLQLSKHIEAAESWEMVEEKS